MSNESNPSQTPTFLSKARSGIVSFCNGTEIAGLLFFAAGIAFSIGVANTAIFALTMLFFLIRTVLIWGNPVYFTKLELPLLGLYVAAIVSSLASYFIGGIGFMDNSFTWVYNYTSPLIFFVIAFSLPNKKRKVMYAMFAVMLVAAAANSCYAIYQFISLLFDSGHYRDLMSVRPSGTMFYMTFGALMTAFATIAISVILRSKIELRYKIIIAVLTLIIVTGLGVSLVRSAWIGLAVAVFVIALIAEKRLLLIFPVVIVLTFIIAPKPIIERVQSLFKIGDAINETEEVAVNEERFAIWRNSLKLAADYPIFGVGMHNSRLLYDDYMEPGDIETDVPHAHNNYIQIVVERGILGLLSFIALIIALFVIFIRLYKTAPRGGGQAVGLAGIGVMSAFLVQGIFEYTFGDYEIMAAIYALAAIAVVYLRWINKGEYGTKPAAENR